jgi:secretion/DNA translocation related TadE-like protein
VTSPTRCERGSITVVMVAVMMVAVLGCIAAAQVATLVSNRAHASAAADAAALATATELSRGMGPSAAKRAAAEIARRSGAQLESCTCSGIEARVTVSVRVGVLGVSVMYARARAVVDFTTP